VGTGLDGWTNMELGQFESANCLTTSWFVSKLAA